MSVVFGPGMKTSISIDNRDLKVGTRITCPAGLEKMATPVGRCRPLRRPRFLADSRPPPPPD